MSASNLVALLLLLLAASLLLGLALARRRRLRALARLWDELATPPDGNPQPFDPSLLQGLPEPARRWLAHTIAPGTAVRQVALLRMHGTILLAEVKPPLPMRAEQVLAPPHGYIWKARVGTGLLRIQGYDSFAYGTGELRWWALGLIPAVTAGGNDVNRSAAGRLAGEAALVPGFLVPRPGVQWEPVDEDTARARVEVGGELVAFTVRVRTDGRLQRVVIDRWNGDPRNGPVGFLPFVVDFEGERRFGGYALPESFSAGWAKPGVQFGEPFFRATLDDAEYR